MRRSGVWSVGELESALAARGWVLEHESPDGIRLETRLVAGGTPFAYCSLECHNEAVMASWQSYHDPRYWGLDDSEQGPKPECTCKLHTRQDGRGIYRIERTADCPWHQWLKRRRHERDRAERDAWLAWSDVQPGTAVVEARGVLERGRGVTAGSAKLVTTSSGCVYALIPCEGWAPHARVRDLDLVGDDG